jgi:hypothetical protein
MSAAWQTQRLASKLLCAAGSPVVRLLYRLPLTQVKGNVSYDGVPLTNGSISFVSESGGENAAGMINAKGEYTLSTHQPGDGAAPGTYRVCISSFETLPGMQPNSGKRAVPEKYFDVRHSGLTATVENRRTQVIDFPLKRE